LHSFKIKNTTFFTFLLWKKKTTIASLFLNKGKRK
jgi:hypothetical protein